MNLYLFVETNRGAVFGIGTYLRELAAALVQNLVNICVVHLNSEASQIQMEEKEGIRHWYIPAPISKQKTIKYQKQLELYYQNISYLLRIHIGNTKNLIFHFNNNRTEALAKNLKKIFDCRIIITIHYFDWCFGLLGNVAHFRYLLMSNENLQSNEFVETIINSYQAEKEFFKTTDHIICLSKHTQHILQKVYQINSAKTSVIYNGLTDSNSFSTKSVLRQKYHIPDIPIILFAGQIADIKGLKYAIRAFKIVLETYTYCHFIIAGNGAFDLFLKECEDIWMHVTWTGQVNKEKLYDLYSIADIGVMPSLYEPFGYVAIEMMMHGLPIVATATSGLNEVVDETCGLKVPVIEYPDKVEIDTDLLAEKILYLLQYPEKAKKMGCNGRKRYLNKYSSKVFGSNMQYFYQSLFEKST